MTRFPIMFVVLVIAFKLFPVDMILLVPIWFLSVAFLVQGDNKMGMSGAIKAALLIYALCLLGIFNNFMLGTSLTIPLVTIVWVACLNWFRPESRNMELLSFCYAVILILTLQQCSSYFYFTASRLSVLLSSIPSIVSIPSLMMRQSVSLILVSLVLIVYWIISNRSVKLRSVAILLAIQLLFIFTCPFFMNSDTPALMLMIIQIVFAAALILISCLNKPVIQCVVPSNRSKNMYLMMALFLSLGLLSANLPYTELENIVIVDSEMTMDLHTNIERGNYGLSRQGMYSELEKSFLEYGCDSKIVRLSIPGQFEH